jgi:glycosyltransferase involved in cell wall biosynthesis
MSLANSTHKKIKIVFILGTLDIGGTERQFVETIRRLNCERFELRALAFGFHGKLQTEIEALHIPFTSLRFPDIKGKFHPVSYLNLYKFIRNIVRYLKQENPHIVQSYLPWANMYGSIAAKIARVPVIITGRRVTVNEKYMHFPRFPHQWLQNLTNLWTTAVITNCHMVKQQALQLEKYMTSEKIRVIYNGIDLKRYTMNIDSTSQKKALQISDDAQIVGIVASLHSRKGHQDFLKAAALVLQTCSQTIFVLVGRNEGMQAILEELAEELDIRDSIIFTGERDDIPELLSMFDVQVSSSLAEGLSNAILEGMAVGNPIVATDIGGNPELVVQEQTGILVPPENPTRLAEAIIRLLGDRELQIRMGNAGRRRVESLFRFERMIQQTEAFYTETLLPYNP